MDETHILTSAHEVGDATYVTIHLYSGERLLGTVAAVDTALDLAVIRVRAFPAGVRRLDWLSAPEPSLTTAVWAWGYPFESNVVGAGFNMAVSVSSGIVSALRTRADHAYIQTDATIHPGSSGGPITTLSGEVVGVIVSTFVVDGERADGIAFALDVTRARDQITALLAAADQR
jgi:S1-C subfamily serine protease